MHERELIIMSPAAEARRTSRAAKLGGREFEEAFKPKSMESTAKELEEKKGREKKKKKKSGFRTIIFILSALIILIGGAAAALYFSGNLNAVFETVGLKKPEAVITLEERQAALDWREAALNEREQELNVLQEKLEAQQKELEEARREASASAAANRTFEEIRSGFSEEKLAELKQVGAIYSKMDPAAAASIITNIYDEKQIAVIIYHMQPAAAALVLANLEAQLAAGVTKILTS
jgi:flagellar motility protein MotE (MotC chaperone)